MRSGKVISNGVVGWFAVIICFVFTCLSIFYPSPSHAGNPPPPPSNCVNEWRLGTLIAITIVEAGETPETGLPPGTYATFQQTVENGSQIDVTRCSGNFDCTELFEDACYFYQTANCVIPKLPPQMLILRQVVFNEFGSCDSIIVE